MKRCYLTAASKQCQFSCNSLHVWCYLWEILEWLSKYCGIDPAFSSLSTPRVKPPSTVVGAQPSAPEGRCVHPWARACLFALRAGQHPPHPGHSLPLEAFSPLLSEEDPRSSVSACGALGAGWGERMCAAPCGMHLWGARAPLNSLRRGG